MIVYFDLDGTLLNSAQCSVITAQDTFKKFLDVDLPAEAIIERMGIPIEVSFRELSNGQINDDNWEDVATYFRAKYKDNSDLYTALYDGIEGFLDSLSKKTENLFIVTSKKSAAAENNLSKLGVSHFFKAVIGSDKVEKYKPDPDPIYQARKILPAPAALEIMIGDADTDIFMGKAAGVKTCAVTWGAHSKDRLEQAKPDYLIESVPALRDMLLSL